jgi:carbamoyltransferase
MLTLGFSGGIDRDGERLYDFAYDEIHDSAAVLVKDGVVVAAIEQERLNRVKHTNKSAGPAMRFCLEHAGASLGELDAIAFYATEDYTDRTLRLMHLTRPSLPELLTARAMVGHVVESEFGEVVDPAKIHFVSHHQAHAVSAYHMSGFDDALVMTIDGQGEGVSGMVFSGRGRELTPLRSIPEQHSLGFLYRAVIRFHGYDMFDEYKVMGLAPYGDPSRFRRAFRTLYDLLPDGDYRLHLDRVPELYRYVRPRRKGDGFTAEHLDLAAALQETLEVISGHLVRHFAAATGHANLCLAGGVAHNCSMNGRLVYSELFESVFVQPASHDAGCALGAALAVDRAARPDGAIAPLRHVLWGTDVPPREDLLRQLTEWRALVAVERLEDPSVAAAQLIADGKVIGWVQGRSEFGPRALGNRSILADPRPAAHKDIINRMVKKREAYRPFAPSVLEERVADFFVVGATGRRFPYMSVVLQVRPDQCDLLGAVTHVDGTARVQTVDRETNPRYWKVIDEFGRLTGVPVVLNTSFNNHAEPIVDSVQDAIVCFLTTDLHALIVGEFLVTKRAVVSETYLDLIVSLPPTLAVQATTTSAPGEEPRRRYEAAFTYSGGKSKDIEPDLYELLIRADGRRTVEQLASEVGAAAVRRGNLAQALLALWSQRMVVLRPACERPEG